MDKILLFNGCSFVAGDAVGWNDYTTKHTWQELNDQTATQYKWDKMYNLYNDYTQNYRAKINLSAECANTLDTAKVDLSRDGNSNDTITLSTIGYLMSVSPEIRKQHHVCVGWTCTDRRIKWENNFTNLTFEMSNDSKYANEYAKVILPKNMPIDNFFNFMLNVINLEKYLQLNQINYTFWLSLPSYSQDLTKETWEEISKIKPHAYHKTLPGISTQNMSDIKNWVNFGTNSILPLYKSWNETLTNSDRINEINGHPNLNAIKNLSKIITSKILTCYD